MDDASTVERDGCLGFATGAVCWGAVGVRCGPAVSADSQNYDGTTKAEYYARHWLQDGPLNDMDFDWVRTDAEQASGRYDWLLMLTPQAGQPFAIIDDNEDWNCLENRNVRGNHRQDWGDPGMNHRTLDRYDD